MNKSKSIVLFLLFALLIPSAAFAQSELFAKKINEDFVAQIQPELLKQAADPNTSPYDFMLIAKRLGVYGNKDAVPVMVPFLNDPVKGHSACTALQAMPFEESLQALRDAVGTVDNPLQKAGVIDALGMREDAGAVDVLLPLLSSSDEIISEAAMFALARIGDPAYMDRMMALLDDQTPEMAKRNADLNLMYAEYLSRHQKLDEAETVYFAVAEKAPFDFYREAALYMILRLDKGTTAKLMSEWLVDADPIKYRACLRAAQFIKNDAITEVLAQASTQISPERRPAVIVALGDQKNPKGQQALLNALTDENEAIKAAALKALKSYADRSSFSRLIEAALSGDEAVYKASVTVLELFDDEVNPDILKLLDGDDAHQILAVELIGARKINAGQDDVFALAQKGSDKVKIAAIRALGEMANTEQFQWLVDQFVAGTQDPEQLEAIKSGLKTACGQILDRNAAAAILAAGTEKLRGREDRAYLFKMFVTLGGTAARDEVSKAAVSKDRESCDLATQTLGEWMDPEVGPILLKLANTPGYAYANRALRGYLRLARQFAMPEWMRRAMVNDALASPVCGDKEKETAEKIIKQYNLDLSQTETDDQKALRNIEIQQVIYGVLDDPQKQKDVTSKVYDVFFNNGTLNYQFAEGFNKAFDGDPAPNIAKKLRITIRYRDTSEVKSFEFNENAALAIPAK